MGVTPTFIVSKNCNLSIRYTQFNKIETNNTMNKRKRRKENEGRKGNNHKNYRRVS